MLGLACGASREPATTGAASIGSGALETTAAADDTTVAATGSEASSDSTAAASDAGGDATDAGSDGGDSTTGSEPLPPMVTQQFLIGYNEAWFGAAFGTDLTTDFDPAYVESLFDGIVADGGHLVRVWLMPVPQGVTLAETVPQSQGVSDALLDNLDEVLHQARRRGLWVYLTLLDANTITNLGGELQPLHDWGVRVLTGTQGEREAFIVHVLTPVLDVVDAHQDNVFGFDIVNEIEAAIQRGVYADPVAGPREFIAAMATAVHDHSPWLRVTSTAGWGGAQYDITNGLFSGLGLDFYDLHVYSDDGVFAGATAMCQRVAQDGVPIYLGEFGQSTEMLDDQLQFDATASFLNNAKALCFSGAFAWRYDSAENWWSFVRPDGSRRPAVQIMQVFGAQP
ncbi:MAG: hypothetical protein K1X88_24930 [Nannocystaceae bacterium]|nr:hypothetical protein [Nannocystaceae bacterium]